jgi:hypothetical protein
MHNLCGARTRTGGVCKNSPMPNGRCRMHGGKNPKGIEHHNYKHGRYSKSVPTRMAERYEEVLRDPERLVLDHELAVAVARNEELLNTLYSGDGRHFRKKLAEEKNAVLKAQRLAAKAAQRGDQEAETRYNAESSEHLEELFRLVDRGASDMERWREWLENSDYIRKISESERKRKVEDQQMASLEEVMAMMGAVLAIITRHVPDPLARSAIGNDIEALISSPRSISEGIVDAEVIE